MIKNQTKTIYDHYVSSTAMHVGILLIEEKKKDFARLINSNITEEIINIEVYY